MYNFWFAVEEQNSLQSLKRGLGRNEINPTWFPVASGQQRPFTNLASALSKSARRGGADALFYESIRQPLPPAGLTRRIPTLVSLDNAQLVSDEILKTKPAGFVVWSEWARTELIKQFKLAPSRVQVVRSGVDLANWDEALCVFERARSRKTGLPERVRLLFIADDFAGMGGEFLLDLFKNNPRLADSCELHLVVNRSAAATYLSSTMRSHHVYVHTYTQPRYAPTELYLNADICVLPSLKSASPSLVAKAMAACLPVVATRVGGLPELVRDGQSGLLVEPGDQVGLVQALQSLIEDPARRYALGEGARHIAEAEFDASINTRKILTLLKQITVEKQLTLEARSSLVIPSGFRHFPGASNSMQYAYPSLCD